MLRSLFILLLLFVRFLQSRLRTIILVFGLLPNFCFLSFWIFITIVLEIDDLIWLYWCLPMTHFAFVPWNDWLLIFTNSIFLLLFLISMTLLLFIWFNCVLIIRFRLFLHLGFSLRLLLSSGIFGFLGFHRIEYFLPLDFWAFHFLTWVNRRIVLLDRRLFCLKLKFFWWADIIGVKIFIFIELIFFLQRFWKIIFDDIASKPKTFFDFASSRIKKIGDALLIGNFAHFLLPHPIQVIEVKVAMSLIGIPLGDCFLVSLDF